VNVVVGVIGVVTLAVGGPDSLGEVELRIGGGTERFLAQAREAIAEGEDVLVVRVLPGRVVDVERWIAPPGTV